MQEIFADKETEGVLLVDASNDYHNRQAALLNMFHLCRPFATTLTKYLSPSCFSVH